MIITKTTADVKMQWVGKFVHQTEAASAEEPGHLTLVMTDNWVVTNVKKSFSHLK